MIRRSPWLWSLPAVVALGFAAQARINYRDQDFTLRDFDNFSATLESDGITFKGTGNPLGIESKASGLVITAKSADGKAVRSPDKSYFLQDVVLNGDVHLQMSQLGNGTATVTLVDSDALHYTGSASQGRIDSATPLTINSSSTGTGIVPTFSRTIIAHGSRGFATFAIGNAPGNPMRTGEMAGPVTFSLHLSNTRAGGVAEVTDLEGKADQLTFDFATDPKTVTLTGNVTVTGKGPTASGDIAAENVVVTLDAQLQPIKVDVTGSPAKTRLRQEPPR
ncbi:MAG: hypothetical protein QOJ65_1620 [Fimbriimonadaceae bacterium]|jgi:hypothetical protein|nr:hypothetical protein [Fimbriimonadaceae bacterium]